MRYYDDSDALHAPLPCPKALRGFLERCITAMRACFMQPCPAAETSRPREAPPSQSEVDLTRRGLDLARLIRRAARNIMQAEQILACRARKAAMLANPAARAQVTEDLGGVDGLSRWEAAQERAAQYLARSPEKTGHKNGAPMAKQSPKLSRAEITYRAQQRAERRRGAAMTWPDYDLCGRPLRQGARGIFRLPPLSRRSRLRLGPQGAMKGRLAPDISHLRPSDLQFRGASLPMASGNLPPIVVTPDELRGEAGRSKQSAKDGRGPRAAELKAPKSACPPPPASRHRPASQAAQRRRQAPP